MTSYRQLVALETAAMNAAPVVAVEVPKVAKVNAIVWYMAILGKYATVADARQVAHARYIAGEDNLSGLEITPIGPDFAELDARLADASAPEMSDAEADRLALDSAQMDSVTGCGGSDLPWDAYPETWTARVLREITEAEAAIKAAREGAAWVDPAELAAWREAEAMIVDGMIAVAEAAPCCPAEEAAPCMGCRAEAEDTPFSDDLLDAIGREPLDPAPTPAPWEAMYADHLAALARRIRESGAATVEEFERWDALHDLAEMEAAEGRGYRLGFEEAQREDCYA